MISAITAKNAAAAKSPIPSPPLRTLTLISLLASWISFWSSEEMSRLASETSRPIVGSSCIGWIAMTSTPLVDSVGSDPTPRGTARPRPPGRGR